jgi:hypothetical protein
MTDNAAGTSTTAARIKSALADPPQRIIQHEEERPSYVAYVDRGNQHHEIGIAISKGDKHFLPCHIGPIRNEIVELSAVDPDFYPGIRKKVRGEPSIPKPSFEAFVAGTSDRIGTAFPHQNHEGHRLKFRRDLPDGTIVELRPTEHYYPAGEGPKQRPHHYRKPRLTV